MLPHDWSMASLLDSEETLMTLKKGQKVSFTFYGKPETATVERVADLEAL